MVKIAVTGSAVHHLPAERGTVSVGVTFRGARRDEVLARASEVHGLLVADAKSHTASGAATWWGADAVVATIRDEWIKPSATEEQTKVRRFWASSRLRVKFADFAVLSRWSVDVAQLDGVSVDGVTWALTETRRDAAINEVRAAAARDATARAHVYAAGLGLGPVRLVALYEDGLRPHVGSGGAVPVMGMRAAAMSAGGDGGFEVRPDDIEVSATVTADFEADAH